MKLILAIIRDSVEDEILRQLTDHHYRVTRIASTGGFLRRGNATLMIGVEEDRLDALIELIHSACDICQSNSETGSSQGNVTLFVLNANKFQQI
jgi:uncharacterized protein YaaQ